MVGIGRSWLLASLIGDAQPLCFFVGRRHSGICGKMFHYFIEALVEYVNGLKNCSNLRVEVFGECCGQVRNVCTDYSSYFVFSLLTTL